MAHANYPPRNQRARLTHFSLNIAAAVGHGRGAHLAEEFGTAVLSELRGRIL
ncbi:hypothetical protein GCM10017567_59340 [Amycolatopsis bullii]|uniref:Uncharacterized protein n=1 Tax=Amycolatopsis bullii TaxID=941987 RepID=A0ABQ3KJZ9_9PSEU|nr:hypothetical protein GCM10017567_59340 [Amycolatopsis bullii]